MSLDALLKQSSAAKKTGVTEKDIELFLPPEYEIGLDQWRELIQFYNRTARQTKVADVVQLYIRDRNPGQPTIDLFTIDEIVEREGRFYTNATFIKTKTGLTAFYIYKAENLKLVPISSPKGEDGIKHVVLTYVSD